MRLSVVYACTAGVPMVLGHPAAVCTSKDITVYSCILGEQGVLPKIPRIKAARILTLMSASYALT